MTWWRASLPGLGGVEVLACCRTPFGVAARHLVTPACAPANLNRAFLGHTSCAQDHGFVTTVLTKQGVMAR